MASLRGANIVEGFDLAHRKPSALIIRSVFAGGPCGSFIQASGAGDGLAILAAKTGTLPLPKQITAQRVDAPFVSERERKELKRVLPRDTNPTLNMARMNTTPIKAKRKTRPNQRQSPKTRTKFKARQTQNTLRQTLSNTTTHLQVLQ